MREAERRLIARISAHWGLTFEEVEGVFDLGSRVGYGKARRLLTKFGYGDVPTSRQIRYLVRSVKLTRRYRGKGPMYGTGR